MKAILLLISVMLALAGCATQAEKTAAADAHANNQVAFENAKAENRKPIFEMKGIANQPITLGGVSSLTVWGQEQQAQFQAAPVQRNEVVEVIDSLGRAVVGVAPYALGMRVIGGMVGMGNQINQAGQAGHGAVTTSTTTTSNANQANTATTTTSTSATTSTAGNNSVIGSGSVSMPATSSTTTTDNSNQGNPHTCTTGTC